MLSVVISTHIRPELLGRCFEALATKRGSFEVLVVNQGMLLLSYPTIPVSSENI